MLAIPEALAGGGVLPVPVAEAPEWLGFAAVGFQRCSVGWVHRLFRHGDGNRHHHAGLPCARRLTSRGGLENIRSLDELREAVIEGAVHRLRPKLLTGGVAIVAIFPMVFATGVGAEVLAPDGATGTRRPADLR